MANFLDNYYKGLININRLNGHDYNLLECQYCNLIFQEQIPNDNFSQELYEEYIDKHESLKKRTILKENIIKNFFMK